MKAASASTTRSTNWVPELAATQAGRTADSPPITIASLLTMSAGLPTDDPWGDRQQDLPLDRFAALLREPLPAAWPPDTRFEYSNLGYGILGRVITNSSGVEYKDFVRDRLLDPLGMTATAYLEEEIPSDRLARGYVRRDDAWQEEPIDGYGALAPWAASSRRSRTSPAGWLASSMRSPHATGRTRATRSRAPPAARCNKSCGRSSRS